MLDVVLGAGDTMYLPRGWLHQALTSDSDSLHITVGVNIRRWIDEARAELEAQEDDIAYRRTIDADEPPELPSLDADEARERGATASCAAGDRSSTVSSPSCGTRAPASTPSSNGETR